MRSSFFFIKNIIDICHAEKIAEQLVETLSKANLAGRLEEVWDI